MYPKYLEAYRGGILQKRADKLYQALEDCDLCPRNCGVNRLKGSLGFCKTGKKARVYSYFSHYGEEPVISGENGSGTIFFSDCNLRCIYCQNYEFSQQGLGKEIGDADLSSFMLELQKQGCHNINFVSPTHVVAQLLKALILAIEGGLRIPLVYNTSGYESERTLKLLEGIIDLYLPDARYGESEAALKYSQAKDYPVINKIALKEMHRQAGIARINNEGIIESGLIIRHLVLPNNLSSTDKIMNFIAHGLSPDTYISLMSQYFPCHRAKDYPELSRRLRQEEYKAAMNIMYSYGLHNGWVQDDQGLDRFAGINIKASL